MTMTLNADIAPAWNDAVHAAQSTFRAALDALARPGRVQILPEAEQGPLPLMPAATALLLTLADIDTRVWLDAGASTTQAQSYLRFHCGCPLTADPRAAAFAVITDAQALDLSRFAAGLPDYPDRSATLLVQVRSLNAGTTYALTGPGIRESAALTVAGLPGDFTQQWQRNGTAFPLGVDMILCCENRIVGLPRTTHLMEQAACM